MTTSPPARRPEPSSAEGKARTVARNIKDGPFCWLSKGAIRRVRDGCEAPSPSLSGVLAVYVVLCELASDSQSETFTASKRRIAERAGVSLRHVHGALDKLRGLGVIGWIQNHIADSKEQGPCTYTLCSAPTAPDALGSAAIALGSATDENAFIAESEKNLSEQSQEESPRKKRRAAALVEIPVELKEREGFADVWESFLESRKQQRKPATAAAAKSILTKLAQRPEQAVSALVTAVERSWRGFEWDWLDNGNPPKTALSGYRDVSRDRFIPPPQGHEIVDGQRIKILTHAPLEPKDWWQGWLAKQYRGFDKETTWEELPANLKAEVIRHKTKGGEYGKPGRFPIDPNAPWCDDDDDAADVDPDGWREWLASLPQKVEYTKFRYAVEFLKDDFMEHRRKAKKARSMI